MISASSPDSAKRALRLGFRAAAPLAAASLVALWGCGGGMPDVSSSTAEATVKGIVKVRGKAVTKGTVIFDPSNIKRPNATAREAPIRQDGTYEVKAIVGGNNVRLGGPLLAKEPSLEYQSQPADIKSGENQIDLEFLPQSP